MNPIIRLTPWSAPLAPPSCSWYLPAIRSPAAPTAPAAPAASPADARDTNARIEAQLAVAQKRLEEATREVARLSEEMSGMLMEQVMPFVGGGHALIGVQLDVRMTATAHAYTRSHPEGRPPRQACVRAM